jgi:hypothetical protein
MLSKLKELAAYKNTLLTDPFSKSIQVFFKIQGQERAVVLVSDRLKAESSKVRFRTNRRTADCFKKILQNCTFVIHEYLLRGVWLKCITVSEEKG